MIISRRIKAAESQAQLRAVLFDVDDTLLDWGARIVPAGYHRLTHLSRVYHYVRNEVHPLTISEEQFNQAAMGYFELYWKQGKQGNGAPHVGRVLTETLVS